MFNDRVSNTASSSAIASFDFGPGICVRMTGPVGSSGKYGRSVESDAADLTAAAALARCEGDLVAMVRCIIEGRTDDRSVCCRRVVLLMRDAMAAEVVDYQSGGEEIKKGW